MSDAARDILPFSDNDPVARLPIESSTPLLETWYYDDKTADPLTEIRGEKYHWLSARIAAMLLLKAPQRGLAADALADSRDWLGVTVTNDWSLPGRKAFAHAKRRYLCSDGTLDQRNEGLPPLVQYIIEENADCKDRDLDSAPVLVAPGGDRITYLVSPADKPRCGKCPSPLTNNNRYHLLMEMLGIDAIYRGRRRRMSRFPGRERRSIWIRSTAMQR